MSSSKTWMRIIGIMSLCALVTSMHHAPRARGASKSTCKFNDLRKSTVTDYNFDCRTFRVSVSTRNFSTNFKDDPKKRMLIYNNNHYFNQKFQPQNAFKCPPCVCKNISYNLVSVVCEEYFLPSISQNWPVEIVEIIIKFCATLEVLDLKTLLMYTSLKRVEISTASLKKIFGSSYQNISSPITEIDLSRNLISIIEDDSFVIFPNMLKLSVSINNLEQLTKQMFTGLHGLRYLSVARNKINYIANDTFDAMSSLVTLDISHNSILSTGDEFLAVRILNPLIHLEQLYINDNCDLRTLKCGTYPNKALQVLRNLKFLCIDCVDRRGLGPEIKNLVHLKSLIIHSPDTIQNLTDETYFDNVPYLTTVVFLTSCPNINFKAYSKLIHLVNLTYSPLDGDDEDYDICQLLNDVQYLLNSSLKYLTLRKVNRPNCGCKELTAVDARYLTHLKLIELDLSKNYLDYLSPEFIELLPATLKKIDLSGNGLSPEIFKSFDKFPKDLVELNLSNQYNVYHPCHVNNALNSRVERKMMYEIGNKHSTNMSSISKINVIKKTYKHEVYGNNLTNKNGKKHISKDLLPPNLRILKGDNFKNFGRILWHSIFALSEYPLTDLRLAGGEQREWAHLCFMPGIEIADFSNNYADDFNTDFFQENTSLKYLYMSNNLFGTALKYDIEGLFLANTKQLIAIDMSKNFITELAYDYFKNLAKLQVLDISQNNLQMINFSFSHMTDLFFLDFSINTIASVSKQSRDDLDLIATNHRVYIDLTSNPLTCTCDGLELMKWMAFTNVYLLSKDFLVCRNEFDQIHEIGNIVQRVEILQRQCASKTVIIVICVFSMIGFGVLLITSLMYRYRWKLRYLRSIALVKLLGSRPGITNMIGYRFDAYILYTDDTRRFVLRDCVCELEEKGGHRLCIEERDFLPGTYIVSNIVSGVQNSAKTVAMVTPEFYQGEYSEYTVKMALMEEIFMRRSVLFLCVCEPTDDEDLSHDLLTAMKQNNYIEYPPRDDVSDEIMEEFWNQFSGAIGRNDLEEI